MNVRGKGNEESKYGLSLRFFSSRRLNWGIREKKEDTTIFYLAMTGLKCWITYHYYYYCTYRKGTTTSNHVLKSYGKSTKK